ncbi:MAG TPA: Ldh family oxidoreductase [Casimicrobiaceae bacterium]|nr:Ldh family oxidoreductase [Casimicrobiaceae bacterium]
MTSTARFDAALLRSFVARAFEAVGLPRADAAVVAELMVDADLGGAEGHGVFRLPQYLRRIRAGGINLQPRMRIERERDGMALIDGDNGMGHLVMKFAAQTAIAKAQRAGVAWVGVHHSNHAGPASLYARMPLAHDMIGLYLAVGNANHLPPWGGIDLLLSTNPIAAAVPALDEAPIVLDMATTVAAYGKVKTKAQRGEPMPEGWMMDREGKPLTDASRANEGFLLPIGGYKGYGLALIFGLLAGTLNGAANGPDTIDFNADDVTPTNTGQAIVAISIEAFGEVEPFKRKVDDLVRSLRNSHRLPGVDRIWLPGEQSHAKRLDYEREGIPLAPALVEKLDELADQLRIPRLRTTR